MHVLFATYEFHPTSPGGAGVLIRHATDHLLAQGHHVTLLIDTPTDAFERLQRVDRLTLPNPRNFHPYLVADLVARPPAWPVARHDVHNLFLWQSARFAHALQTLLATPRDASRSTPPIDLIEFFDFAGAGYHAAILRRFHPADAAPLPPVQIRTHGPLEVIDALDPSAPPPHATDPDRALLYRLERAALALADRVIVPSMTFADSYLLAPYNLPDARTIAIEPPPPIVHDPITAEPPIPARLAPSSHSTPITITFVGRIFPLKGVDQLVRVCIDLFTRRPNLNATVELLGSDSINAGQSFSKQLLASIPAPFRERFSFTGHVPADHVRDALRRATIVVFPNRVESFCYALHEAALESSGALILRDIPAFRAFIGNAPSAPALLYRDDAELLDAIQRLIDDPSLRVQLRAAAVRAAFTGRARARLSADELVGPLPLPAHHDAPPFANIHAVSVGVSNANPFSSQSLMPTYHIRVASIAELRTKLLDSHAISDDASIAILNDTTNAHPAWLHRCTLALRRDPTAAFAGSWLFLNNRPLARLLDLDPLAERAQSNSDPRLAAWAHRQNPAGPAVTGLVIRNATTLAAILAPAHGSTLGRSRADQPASLQGIIIPELLLSIRDRDHS